MLRGNIESKAVQILGVGWYMRGVSSSQRTTRANDAAQDFWCEEAFYLQAEFLAGDCFGGVIYRLCLVSDDAVGTRFYCKSI